MPRSPYPHLAAVCLACLICAAPICAQRTSIGVMSPQGTLPLINVGGNDMEASFARLDFATMMLDEQRSKGKMNSEEQQLVTTGAISALDLQAPNRALTEFNRATELMRSQQAEDAAKHLQKAISLYPNFVSAHNNLGLAYLSMDQRDLAASEFQSAAKLDAKFPGSFLNLGKLALEQHDYSTADANLTKAADLLPRDVSVLTVLAYAENGAREYRKAISTAERVHGMDHKQLANAHYVAAAAAIELKDYPIAQRELAYFVAEDPTNALAPLARKNIDILSHPPERATAANASASSSPDRAGNGPDSLANSDKLKSELSALGDETADESCTNCEASGAPSAANEADLPSNRGFTVRKTVDEVAVFFSASSHGHSIYDLQQNDIKILDNDKPPARVMQFVPQSKLPMRLALLIDTSGSVEERLTFEKHAAEKFMERVLTGASDLAFVEGFSNTPEVTQDFSSDHSALTAGIEKLHAKGGTALFDAVSNACLKLSAYPEHERVARVLVLLTDGEENSSHETLKQAIQDAEANGVTVYAISTRTGAGEKTDADKMLEALAGRSGGEAFFPGDLVVLGKAFDRLSDTIRSRYLIAYKPADFVADGKFRSIAITATQSGKRLQVRSRKGYHARFDRPPAQQ